MDFTPRGRAPAPQQTEPVAHHPQQPVHHSKPKRIDWAGRTVRLELFIVIVGSALLLAAVALYIAFSGGINTEANKINKDKFQAVFLNGGVTSGSVSYSTYFGHISKLNDNYVVLTDVYYLTDQSSQGSSGSSSPQLTKLGCQQLHSPYDEMVINRNQVAFWENIQDSGKVVQAIKSFQTANPHGPNCSQTSSSAPSSTTTPTPAPTPTPSPSAKQ